MDIIIILGSCCLGGLILLLPGPLKWFDELGRKSILSQATQEDLDTEFDGFVTQILEEKLLEIGWPDIMREKTAGEVAGLLSSQLAERLRH
jgi:hypothetical protein